MRHKKSNFQKDILFIIISSFIVVLVWIGFNIHHVLVTSTIEEEIQLHLEPINGAFDTQTIHQTKNRLRVDPLYEKTGNVQPTPLRNVTEPSSSPRPEQTIMPTKQVTP